MNQRNAEKDYQDKRAEILGERDFSEISPKVRDILRKAMMYTSLMNLGCLEVTYDNLINHTRPFKLAEIPVILTILIGATPIELGQTLEENLDMLNNIVYPLRDEWNELENQVSDKVAREVNFKVRMGVGLPPQKKLYIPTS